MITTCEAPCAENGKITNESKASGGVKPVALLFSALGRRRAADGGRLPLRGTWGVRGDITDCHVAVLLAMTGFDGAVRDGRRGEGTPPYGSMPESAAVVGRRHTWVPPYRR